MAPTLDAVLLEGWVEAATSALERHRAEIDRINVFPVADGDTGTNLLLTMRSAAAAAVRSKEAAAVRSKEAAAVRSKETAAVRPGDAARSSGDVTPARQEAGVAARAGAAVAQPDDPAAARLCPSGPGPTVVSTARALARGALRGARGNSGVILSQVLRGVAEALAAAKGPCAGAALTDALARGARLAEDAVARPREGTVLTVLAAAAAAAAATGSDRLEEVAVAAAEAAAGALRATTGQLPELARAGVVDAGGLGLYLVLDALAALTAGRPAVSEVPAAPAPRAGPALPGRPSVGPALPGQPSAGHAPGCPEPAAGPLHPGEPAYEVMYLLDGADDGRVAALRSVLDGLGDAVAVVGDGAVDGTGTWTVHVHCADIGAALEAGVVAGRPHEVRVTPLVDRVDRFSRERAVVAVVCGPEAAALARAAGAEVLVRDLPPAGAPGEPYADVDADLLTRALADTGARHVALLPCDAALASAADRAAAAARRAGQEVVVVPAVSVVAGLAALAVHDPARHPGDDVVAMTEAAAGTRSGALLVADSEALTWAGRCRPGDVLGLVDGEVVLIAPDLAVGALWLASRMVTAGGELVTVLLGAEVPDAFGDGLAAELRRTHPEVDVVVHRGARWGLPMELGVE